MVDLDGKVVAVSGAGRGLGREHALLLGSLGARVLVNDLGGSSSGVGSGSEPAESVAAEIRDGGGEAAANGSDVSDWKGGAEFVGQAIDTWGRLDALVNNAGILRDSMLVSLTEEDWDLSIRVNLKGHVAPSRAAAAFWREQSKAGENVSAAIVNTASESGVFGNVGQSNYNAAKSGVASLTETWTKELGRYGVRVNAILPRARTRLTEGTFGADAMAAGETAFDAWHPGNVSPFVAYLISDRCSWSGHVCVVGGGLVQRVSGWSIDRDWKLTRDARWSVDALADAIDERGEPSNEGRHTGFIR